MKEYIIERLIEKLDEIKGENRLVYMCELDYELWQGERVDGTITYSNYEAVEWIKKYFYDIGEVWEELQFEFDKEFLSKFNPFDNSEEFMLLIVCEASGRILASCPYISNNWDNEIELNNYRIGIIKKQLKELNDGGCIYA